MAVSHILPPHFVVDLLNYIYLIFPIQPEAGSSPNQRSLHPGG